MIRAKVRADMTPEERLKRMKTYSQAELERCMDYDKMYKNELSENPNYMSDVDVTRHNV